MTKMTADQAIRDWLTAHLPADLFDGEPEITIDREEITIVGSAAAPERPEGTAEPAYRVAVGDAVARFRETTRDRRVAVARELEHRSGRKVSWGVECDGHRVLFTHLAVPVMTRLRQPERMVLDTLVAAGVARSRADAVAWCVRLVGRNTDEWLAALREAMDEVAKVRATGPDV